MRKIVFIWFFFAGYSILNGQNFKILYEHKARQGILDGNRKTFLVTGYSTSHVPRERPWPSILQEMLNNHVGNDTTYYVFKHTVGGTPIAKWTDICGTGKHITDAINYYVNPGGKIDAGIPKATIMLAQQSLQWAFGDCNNRFIGIEEPDDEIHIQQGAQAIICYISQFLESGIESAYMATHIYKTGNYPLNLLGEQYALTAALDSLDNFYPGPELFEITESLFPEGFASDKVHPGAPVANAMALYWYLVIAGEDSKREVMEPVAESAGIDIPDAPVNIPIK